MTLDRDQVALASARNIGALAMIKRKRPAQLSTVNVTFDSTYRASADTCRQTHPTTLHLPHQPEKGSSRVSEPLGQAQSNLGH